MTDDKAAPGGVEQPDEHWRCFHCGEVFTDVWFVVLGLVASALWQWVGQLFN